MKVVLEAPKKQLNSWVLLEASHRGAASGNCETDVVPWATADTLPPALATRLRLEPAKTRGCDAAQTEGLILKGSRSCCQSATLGGPLCVAATAFSAGCTYVNVHGPVRVRPAVTCFNEMALVTWRTPGYMRAESVTYPSIFSECLRGRAELRAA